MSEIRTFKCQQCGLITQLVTVFNYEVCPSCRGNLFLLNREVVVPIDWKDRAEKAEAKLSVAHATVRGIIQSALAGYESDYKDARGYIKWGEVGRDIEKAFEDSEDNKDNEK